MNQEKKESLEKLRKNEAKELETKAELNQKEFNDKIEQQKRELIEAKKKAEHEIELHLQNLKKQELELEIANKSASTLLAKEESKINANLFLG